MIGRVLAFIRFSHTVFALPFALGSAFVAANGLPDFQLLMLIILAMVFARTAAMAFNRLADWKIDQRNPRTEGRHRLISWNAGFALWITSSIGFIWTTSWINILCFALSPIALAILFFYSFTKRFTSYSHFFLGLALAISPVGAWLAVTGRFDLAPMVLALAVLFWVAGFDLIYAIQDYDFDRNEGLKSLVVALGPSRSLTIAVLLHFLMWLLLVVFGLLCGLGIFYYSGLALIFLALIYEHRIARKLDVTAINRAFFQSNAFVGFVFVSSILLDRMTLI